MAKAPAAKNAVRLWLVGKNSYKLLGTTIPQVKRGGSASFPAEKAAQLLKQYGTIMRNGTVVSVPAFVDSAQLVLGFLGYDVDKATVTTTLGGEPATDLGSEPDHVEITTPQNAQQQGGMNIG